MPNAFELNDQHILVTGASSGIGRACVRVCAALGARVTLLARNQERLQQVLDELEDPSRHGYLCVDVMDESLLQNAVAEAIAQRGKLDGFIHAAGIRETAPVASAEPADYHKAMDVNMIAGFQLLRLLTKRSRRNANLSAVYVSSVMGIVGQPGSVTYCASKGALIAAVRAAAVELAAKGIRVNCVSPGMVMTEMGEKLLSALPESSRQAILDAHPLGFGQAEDVAHMCAFLLSPASRWATGANFVIDGGYTSS